MTKSLSIMAVVEYLIWPALCAFVVLATWALLEADVGYIAAVGVVLILLRLLVLLLEFVVPLDPRIKFYKDRDLGGDLIFWVYRLVSSRYLTTASVLLFAQNGLLPTIAVWPSHFPLVVQLALFFLIYELLNYWQHRLDHEIPFLWRMHAIHHSPTQMHHFKKDRHHVSYMLILAIFIIYPLTYVGAPAEFFLWFTLWEGANSTLKHSNVRHKLPLLLHYIVPSAGLHHLHHSTDSRQGNSNFANFPLLDVLFGTFTPPDTPMPAYGVEGDPVPSGFIAGNIFPFTRTARARLSGGAGAPLSREIRGG